MRRKPELAPVGAAGEWIQRRIRGKTDEVRARERGLGVGAGTGLAGRGIDERSCSSGAYEG